MDRGFECTTKPGSKKLSAISLN